MERKSTIADLMERRRILDGAKEYKGHTYLDLARFDDKTKHMIIVPSFVDCTYICTSVFCRNNFCTNFLSMGSNDDYRTMVSNHKLQNLIKS